MLDGDALADGDIGNFPVVLLVGVSLRLVEGGR